MASSCSFSVQNAKEILDIMRTSLKKEEKVSTNKLSRKINKEEGTNKMRH